MCVCLCICTVNFVPVNPVLRAPDKAALHWVCASVCVSVFVYLSYKS